MKDFSNDGFTPTNELVEVTFTSRFNDSFTLLCKPIIPKGIDYSVEKVWVKVDGEWTRYYAKGCDK